SSDVCSSDLDPTVALIGLAIFGGSYALIYRTVRRRLVRFGRQISQTNTERFRLMNEGFGGIKDILLTGREQNFIQQFNTTGQTLANAQGSIRAMSQIPRYFIGLLRSEEHTSELQSRFDLVCRLLLEKKNKKKMQ